MLTFEVTYMKFGADGNTVDGGQVHTTTVQVADDHFTYSETDRLAALDAAVTAAGIDCDHVVVTAAWQEQ